MPKFLAAFLMSAILHLLIILPSLEQSKTRVKYSENEGARLFRITVKLQKKPEPKSLKGVDKSKRKRSKEIRESYSSKKNVSSSGDNEAIALYLKKLRLHIASGQLKTRMARKLRLQGQVRLGLTVKKPNIIKEVRILESSRLGPLDQSALLTIRSLNNVPELPKSIKAKEIEVLVNMIF